MNSEESKGQKIGFFKNVWNSITKVEKYPEMSAQGFGKASNYFIKLIIILVAVFSFGIVYQFHNLVVDCVKYLENEFPDFSYKDGTLQIDSEEMITVPKEIAIGTVIVDTNEVEDSKIDEYINMIDEDEIGFVILKDNVITKNLSASGGITTYKYEEIAQKLNITEFNKKDLIDYATGNKIISMYVSIFLIFFIYDFIIYLIVKILDVLLLSLFGYITAIFARIKIRYIAIFNMSAYALTLSMLLNIIYIGINVFVPFTIKYFQVMYVAVAAIYLIAAILILKTDLIKQQLELMKIVETEKDIKEQLKEKEEEEKEEKEKEDEKEKRKNKDKEEQDIPDDTAGSNA